MLLLIRPVCSSPTLYRYGCVCMGLHLALAIAAAGHSKLSSYHASLQQCVSWASEWQAASDVTQCCMPLSWLCTGHSRP